MKRNKRKHSIRFTVLTLFPDAFESYLGESLFKKACQKKIVTTDILNIRDFAVGLHKQADDRPFGGGPGMVLKVEPIYKAVSKALRLHKKEKTRVILFSTRGKKLDAKSALRLSKFDQLVLICGRYEGVDERVASHIADEEVSIGDYVLSGGELPALVLMEAVSRFIPGFLGKHESLEEIKGSYPVYTRPAGFITPNRSETKKRTIWNIPNILLSGDHKKISEWREKWQKPT